MRPNLIVMEDENFKKDLEDLFVLFQRYLEKEAEGGIPGVDPSQMEQLKRFMTNLDEVKSNIRSEHLNVDPFTKMMISTLVKQLREEMGPVSDLETSFRPSAEEVVSRREELLSDVTDPVARNRALLETIDEQLRNPDLSDEEMDALLDKRRQISSNL